MSDSTERSLRLWFRLVRSAAARSAPERVLREIGARLNKPRKHRQAKMTVPATGGPNNRASKPQIEPAKVLSDSLMEYAIKTQVTEREKDLTVCDIIGEWGLYQWSLILFAAVYSGMFCTVVVVGPLWTPDMAHICVDSHKSLSSDEIALLKEQNFGSSSADRLGRNNSQRECSFQDENGDRSCTRFVYDDQKVGRMLTNSVSVCFLPLSSTSVQLNR